MRPRSLYRHIYMHFLGVLFAVGVVSSWIFAGGPQRRHLVDVAVRLTAHTARLLEEAPDPAARAALAARLADELAVDLTLFDADGRVLVRRGAALPTPTAADRRDVVRPRMVVRGWRWFVAAPVRPPAGPPLFLEVSSHETFPRRPLVTLLGVMLLVAIAVRPLARRISRPIEWLIVASRRFGEGDLTTRVRVPLSGRHGRGRGRWKGRHLGDELYTLMHAWNDMAERIERQVGQQRELLANVSHELRSPLARVRVALALLPDEPATQRRIADIEADLAELDALIEQILQTSRLEATSLPTHSERFAVAQLFDEVLARAEADPATAALRAQVDEARPPGALALEGDRALLRRALFNLVENAGKYGAAPVTLGVERDREGVTLCVQDAGPGIPAGERERMLRPFMRGDRAHTPGRGGVGLGLAFAARVAEVHGGRLTLDDAPHRGLLVRLWLPASRLVG